VLVNDIAALRTKARMERETIEVLNIDIIINSLQTQISREGIKRVFIDGLSALSVSMHSEEDYKRCVFLIFSLLRQMRVTTLITSEFVEPGRFSKSGYEEFLADSLILLSKDGWKRYVEIIKMRGSDFAPGKHFLRIISSGLVVYPRLKITGKGHRTNERISTGIAGLDAMLSGGLLKGSTTIVSGPSGVGKSIIGLEFLVHGAQLGERGLMLTFEETPNAVEKNAQSFDWDIGKYEKEEKIKIIYGVGEFSFEELVYRIKEEIEKNEVKRFVFDSVTKFFEIYGMDVSMDALIDILRSKGITSMFINEVSEILGSGCLTGLGMSVLMDTVITMRYIELESHIGRAILVLKMRGSMHDKKIREMKITSSGVEVLSPFIQYENILSGNPRKTPSERAKEFFEGL
jgi:circadian clock protein KaiC